MTRRLRPGRACSAAAAFAALMFAAGSPAFADPSDPSGSLTLQNYRLRHQDRGERVFELSGGEARLLPGNAVDMDSVSGAVYRHNKSFIELSARRAALGGSSDKKDSAVWMSGVSGRLFFGGVFRSTGLHLRPVENLWSAAHVVFRRAPVVVHMDTLSGPLSFEEARGESGVIVAGPSRASARRFRFDPATRLIYLDGNASYVSDTVSLAAPALTLQFDPTFSRLLPVTPRPARGGLRRPAPGH